MSENTTIVNINIRPAFSESDIRACAELNAQSLITDYVIPGTVLTKEVMEKHVDRPEWLAAKLKYLGNFLNDSQTGKDRLMIVAEIGETVVGFALAENTPNEEGEGCTRMFNGLYSSTVKDTRRHYGIGAALVSEVVAWHTKDGEDDAPIKLIVCSLLKNAKEFHESYGFELDPTTKIDNTELHGQSFGMPQSSMVLPVENLPKARKFLAEVTERKAREGVVFTVDRALWQQNQQGLYVPEAS